MQVTRSSDYVSIPIYWNQKYIGKSDDKLKFSEISKMEKIWNLNEFKLFLKISRSVQIVEIKKIKDTDRIKFSLKFWFFYKK